MQTFVLYALLGIGSGAVYAILAHGLTVIYKGSGVLNFAQAAIAMFAAYCYVAMRHGGVPAGVAIAVTIAGATLAGFLFAYGVMRPLRNAPVLARAVATLGLFTVLTALVLIIWPTLGVTTVVTPLFPSTEIALLGGVIGQDRFWLAGVAIVLSVILWALYKYTVFGLATRGAAGNERGAAVLGFSPDLIAGVNWAIGSGLAGLGGILVAPLTGLAPSVALLIVPVLAAALLGRFSSFAITTAAAFVIGALQSVVGYYWNSQPGVQAGIPFLVVMVAMVITGRLIPARGTLTSGRPPLAPPSRIRLLPTAGLVVIVVILLVTLNRTYQAGIATSLIMAIVGLSLVVVTGFVGQISLAQMGFAGAGAFAVSKFAYNLGIPFPLPIFLAAVVTVPAGIVLGLPALRVRGVNLAVITLGAAVTISAMVFADPALTGGYSGSQVPSPRLGGFSLDPVAEPVRFGIMCLIVLLLALLLVVNLRRSSSGRRMLAVRGNERAAAALGVNVPATKLQAFALSAFIGALGGGVLAYQLGNVSFQQFDPTQSITVLTIVYIGSIAAVSGGLIAGLAASGGLVFVIFSNIGAVGQWWGVAAGIVVILTVMFQPDGAAVGYSQQWSSFRARVANRPGGAPLRAEAPSGADAAAVLRAASVRPATADNNEPFPS